MHTGKSVEQLTMEFQRRFSETVGKLPFLQTIYHEIHKMWENLNLNSFIELFAFNSITREHFCTFSHDKFSLSSLEVHKKRERRFMVKLGKSRCKFSSNVPQSADCQDQTNLLNILLLNFIVYNRMLHTNIGYWIDG